MEKLKSIREDYDKHTLTEEHLTDDPMEFFQFWMEDALASDEPEPTAVQLATVDANGQPSLRVVLLKGFDARGFQFFTNYQSKKGQEISENNQVALCVLWKSQQRQIRIEGRAVKMDQAESTSYFQSRPKESQIGAWASAQSAEMQNPSDLVNKFKEISQQYADVEVLPCPEHWGGYIVAPTAIEFWQGRQSRLHDRFRYELTGDVWKASRLWP